MDPRTNKNYFPIQHHLTDIYTQDRACLLHDMNWVSTDNSS